MISFDWCIFWFSDNLLYCLCVEKIISMKAHDHPQSFLQYLILRKFFFSYISLYIYLAPSSLGESLIKMKDIHYGMPASTTQKRFWMHDIICISSQFSIYNLEHVSLFISSLLQDVFGNIRKIKNGKYVFRVKKFFFRTAKSFIRLHKNVTCKTAGQTGLCSCICVLLIYWLISFQILLGLIF